MQIVEEEVGTLFMNELSHCWPIFAVECNNMIIMANKAIPNGFTVPCIDS